MLDAVVIGSGPNGLAAAVELAREGHSVVVLEGHSSIGGGTRTEALTWPGFVHDVCSTVHPLGRASPFFRSLGWGPNQVEWRESPSALAHVVTPDHVVTLERSLGRTAAQFGPDTARYEDLLSPFVERFDELLENFLGPLRLPSSPGLFAAFACKALLSVKSLLRGFRDEGARALLAGIGAHAMLPLDAPATASFALILAAAGHAVGWPIVAGGSARISAALSTTLRAHGGDVILDHPVTCTRALPAARVYLFDVTPRQLVGICGEWLSASYRRRLSAYRYGPGTFKLDWALSEPVPWSDPRCRRATTVHLAGTLEDVHAAEASVHRGRVAAEPFVLFVQPTLVDAERAPPGRHVGWAYVHTPHGSREPLGDLVERRLERYAPGFRDTILARHFRDAGQMELYNPNYVGGDINGGSAELGQLLFRPLVRADPYATSNPDVFLCSSSTPPGGGVHGLCGYWAARSALRRLRRRAGPPLLAPEPP